MKHLIPLLTVLCLVLSGCAGTPTGTTAPETTLPPQTTVPESSSVPTEPTVPPTTAPVADHSYTVSIQDPEKQIHAEPDFRSSVTAIFGEAGVYTIVEEEYDRDGNLWGKLKSGLGWVCLTDPAIVPIFADYAPEHFVSDYNWHCGETDYVTDIGILANEHITNVTFCLLDALENYRVVETLYTVDEMNADTAMKLSVVFWGDFTTYGVSFIDANGNQRAYALMVSGKDGSLICTEYTP